MTLRKFLHHVVRGEHAKMQNMLRANSDLLWQRGIVMDNSGREFGSISGFEYALWALDKHQWDDMLACLPRDKQGHLTESGRKIVEELLRQYEQIKTKGVTYRLNGEGKTESHYDFAIISVLQEQVNARNASGDKDWNAIEKHWCQCVGGMQRRFPVHVVNEYCSIRDFSPVPQFDVRPIPVNGLHQFYNCLSEAWESWFGIHSRLGIDFAIYKNVGHHTRWGGWRAQACGDRQASNVAIADDLSAMKALCEIRTKDFILLEAQLKSLLVVEEQPRPGLRI